MSDNRAIMSGSNFFSRNDNIILSHTQKLCGSVVENLFEGLSEPQSNFLLYKLVDTRECINKLQISFPHGDITIKQL